jgi:hypothetical protein
LLNAPTGARIRIEGYADNLGTDAHNDRISRQRAEAVAALLKKRLPGCTYEVAWFGKARPDRPNRTVADRAANRRVLVRVFLPEKSPEPVFELQGAITNIIAPFRVAILKDSGMTIHDGFDPPDIEGVFIADDQVCTFDSQTNHQGSRSAVYHYRFSNQNNETKTVEISYRGAGGKDSAIGSGGFVSGSGDRFSVFFELQGVSRNENYSIDYTQVMVFSGRIGPQGIRDLQFGLIVTAKAEDPEGLMMPVDARRIFTEQDRLARRGEWPKE